MTDEFKPTGSMLRCDHEEYWIVGDYNAAGAIERIGIPYDPAWDEPADPQRNRG